ncbi:MAG: spore coat protein CotJB [Oscillospiraceae bacterium]|nr:spore coat protein CotJB [Oscillospiraceae bacterium]
MENKAKHLMRLIQMYDFYLYELQLYLDTHPTCSNGLQAFRKYKELRSSAVKTYTDNYGPITAVHSDCSNVFEWAKGPWPWEKEAN